MFSDCYSLKELYNFNIEYVLDESDIFKNCPKKLKTIIKK